LGYLCPSYFNPADFVLELVSSKIVSPLKDTDDDDYYCGLHHLLKDNSTFVVIAEAFKMGQSSVAGTLIPNDDR